MQYAYFHKLTSQLCICIAIVELFYLALHSFYLYMFDSCWNNLTDTIFGELFSSSTYIGICLMCTYSFDCGVVNATQEMLMKHQTFMSLAFP